jgi:hypothetical protein
MNELIAFLYTSSGQVDFEMKTQYHFINTPQMK